MTQEEALLQAALAITDERAVLRALAAALAACAPDCVGLAAALKESGGVRVSFVVLPGGKLLDQAPPPLVRACQLCLGLSNAPVDTQHLSGSPNSVATLGLSLRNPIRTLWCDDGSHASLVADFPPAGGSFVAGPPAIHNPLAHAAALASASAYSPTIRTCAGCCPPLRPAKWPAPPAARP